MQANLGETLNETRVAAKHAEFLRTAQGNYGRQLAINRRETARANWHKGMTKVRGGIRFASKKYDVPPVLAHCGIVWTIVCCRAIFR